MQLLLALLVTALASHSMVDATGKLTEVFKWKQLDIKFPNDTIRNSLLKSGRYSPYSNHILGLAVWRNKLFLSIPRWLDGAGAALTYVDLNTYDISPQLIPYPDYESNYIYSGDLNYKVISTSRIFVDKCDRLWVPDNGIEGFYSTPRKLAPHKVLVYDLKTNKLLRSIIISEDVKKPDTVFFEITVEVNDDCNKAFAYVADPNGFAIVVYNWETDSMHKVLNSYMYFEAQSAIFRGTTEYIDGVMGMTLSGVNPDGYRTMYFHALASNYEYNVSTQVLQDPTLSKDFKNFKFLGSRGENAQSTNQRFDELLGVKFYTLVNKFAIGCWNSKQYPGDYTPATNGIAALDREKLLFPSALTLDRYRNVWVLSDNHFNYNSPVFNRFNYNYRVMYAPVDALIKDTVCDADNY